MNKIYFQFSDDSSDENLEFMYLNPISVYYERVDMHNPPGEASTYEDEQELKDNFDGQLNSFRLELVYE